MFGLFKRSKMEAKTEDHYKERIQKYLRIMQAYQDEKYELVGQLDFANKQIKALGGDKVHLLNLVTEYQGKLRGVTSAVLQEEVNQVEIARLNEILTRQKAVDLQKDAEISALHKRIDQLNSQLKESEALSRERSEHIDAQREAIIRKSEEIDRIEALNHGLVTNECAQLAELKEENMSLKGLINGKDEYIKDLDKKLSQLQAGVEMQMHDIVTRVERIRALEAEVASRQAEADEFQAEADRLDALIDNRELRRFCIEQAPQHTPVYGMTTIEVAQKLYSWIRGEGE